MNITLSANLPRINAQVLDRNKLQTFAVQELLNTQLRLRKEIAQGKGANGQAIKSSGYSIAYKLLIRNAKQGFSARKSAQQARGLKNLPRQHFRGENALAQKDPDTVNLFLTGGMLKSVQVKKEGNLSARMFMGSSEMAARAGKLMSRGFQGWFEYGAVDIRRIEEAVKVYINNLANKVIEPGRK